MILSEAVSLQDAPLLTACAAVAAARAIDALYGTQMQIKWVNDLYLDGKKCCGILTEGGVSLESGKLEHAIIGIGINVRNTSIAMPEELRHTVTSLEEARPDIHVCRAQLLATVLYEMEQVLRELPQRRFLAEYRSRSCLIGKTVELTKDDGTVKKWLYWKLPTTAVWSCGTASATWKPSTPEKCTSVQRDYRDNWSIHLL